MKNRYIRMSIVIIFLIFLDQIIKLNVINNIEKVPYLQNSGGAFGIGDNSTTFFILINIVVLGIIIKFIYSQKDRIDRKTLISLTLILAGGFSNLIDRIVRGFVIDYIDITGFVKFPLFNIADICIVLGWILLFISIVIFWYKEVRINNKEGNF